MPTKPGPHRLKTGVETLDTRLRGHYDSKFFGFCFFLRSAMSLCFSAWILSVAGRVLFVVDGAGFHADVQVIEEAASGIAESVRDQDSFELRGLCGEPELYGHTPLRNALMDFCVRWSGGLDALTDDAGTIADSLARVARAYRAVDSVAAQTLGADPAKQAVDG